MKKHIVRLSASERAELLALVKKGKAAAYKRLNAQILLKADIGEQGPGWTDAKIVEAFDVCLRKVERLRQRLCSVGFEQCLKRAKGSGRKRKLDGTQEAQLIALSCSEPPEGSSRWTLRMIADKAVELNYVDEISHEAVRQLFKKRNKTLAK